MTTTPGAPPAQPAGQRSRGGGRTALVVIGTIVTVLGAGTLIAGSAFALWANAQRDDGTYTAGPETIGSESHALVVDDLDLSGDGPDVFYGQDLLGEVRIDAMSTGGDALFVGIGPASDVAAFVEGTGYDEVTDVESDPFALTVVPHAGDEPAEPASQDFWVASAEGTGAQSLAWEVRDGEWSVVLMNADASAGVEAEVSAGATLPFVMPVAIAVVVLGVVLLAIGLALLIVGLATGRRRPVYEARPR